MLFPGCGGAHRAFGPVPVRHCAGRGLAKSGTGFYAVLPPSADALWCRGCEKRPASKDVPAAHLRAPDANYLVDEHRPASARSSEQRTDGGRATDKESLA